jgi:hypothetical protein
MIKGKTDPSLLTKVESADEGGITGLVFPLEVLEQATALAYELKKPTASVVILLVGFKMLGEVVDTVRKESYLHFRGAGIRSPAGKLLHGFFFGFYHFLIPISFNYLFGA